MPATELAHDDDKMACYTCHTSWTTSCAGCHLPIEANWKTERHHYEGGETRNFATYNPQVARDDMFQLGHRRPGQGQQDRADRARARRWCSRRPTSTASTSTSSSRRSRRAASQPGVRAALSAHRAQDRDQDLHRLPRLGRQRQQRDHGAAPAARHQLRQLRRLQRLGRRGGRHRGGARHRMGRAAGGDRQLPAPLRLSRLLRGASQKRDRRAADDRHATALGGRRRAACSCAASISTSPRARAACASTTSPASPTRASPSASSPRRSRPLGQRHAHRVAATRPAWRCRPTSRSIRRATPASRCAIDNQEQPFHPIYHYAYITDAEEGLILTNVDTLADGEPRNNFLKRARDLEPGRHAERRAPHRRSAARYAYIAADAGS